MPASKQRQAKRLNQQQIAVGRSKKMISYYKQRALNMYTAQRHYTGMGDYFNAELLESVLYHQGWATIWYDPIVESFLCAQMAPDSDISLSGEYTRWMAVTPKGNIELDTSKAVIVYDSTARYVSGNFVTNPIAPAVQVQPLIDRLTLLDRSTDVNVNSLAVPIIFQGPEEMRLSINQQMQMIDQGARYIYVVGDPTKGLDMRIEALRTEATNNIASFSTERDKTWSELLSVLGIQNVGISKAERLITAEADANNEQINLIAWSKLTSRRQALNKLNAMYNTDCKVEMVNARMDTGEIRPNYQSSNNGATENMMQEESGVEEDG